jgi:bifunctional non-homologous end joining protein LigD
MAKDKLSTCRAKRDFDVTQEPHGEAEGISSNHRRFIIQKQDANRPSRQPRS